MKKWVIVLGMRNVSRFFNTITDFQWLFTSSFRVFWLGSTINYSGLDLLSKTF